MGVPAGALWMSESARPWARRLAARRQWEGAHVADRRIVGVLKEGTLAPDFDLPDQHGNRVKLSDFRGRWLVLWWFPKAFTAG
jgi:hypothetical protein